MTQNQGFSILVSAVMFATVFAGCTAECGPTDSANWIQPGLYDKLKEQRDATVHDPVPGLEPGTALRAYFGNASVQGVEYVLSAPTPENQSIPFIHVSLYVTPHTQLELIAPDSYSDAQATSSVIAFLENTSASPEKWDDWQSGILSQLHNSREPRPGEAQPAVPGGGPTRVARVDVDGAWKIPNLIARLGFDKAPQANTSNMPGEYHLDQGPWGPWKISLQIPSIEFHRTVPEGKLTLRTDLLNQTFGTLERKESPGQDHNGTVQAFGNLSRDLGIAPADLRSDSFRTLIC